MKATRSGHFVRTLFVYATLERSQALGRTWVEKEGTSARSTIGLDDVRRRARSQS
jgi:hypothetical protein